MQFTLELVSYSFQNLGMGIVLITDRHGGDISLAIINADLHQHIREIVLKIGVRRLKNTVFESYR